MYVLQNGLVFKMFELEIFDFNFCIQLEKENLLKLCVRVKGLKLCVKGLVVYVD